MRRLVLPLLCLALGLAGQVSVAGSASASPPDRDRGGVTFSRTVGAVTAVTGPGTGPAPSTIGALSVTRFAEDTRAYEVVSSARGPLGDVGFSVPVTVLPVGDGWATWSHGYAGSVYSPDAGTPVTLTLPPTTRGFALYAEPNSFEVYDITVVAQEGGTTSTQHVQGEAGAAYFGFYTSGTATLTSITVSTADDDFAIGEFAIAQSVYSGYVALGDSYSSGEGAGGKDGYDGGECHRTANAWPQVMSQLNARLHLIANYACSGAETPAMVKSFHKQAPQVDDLRGVPTAQTITVTIGGNDIGFGKLITDCVVLDPCDDELDKTRKKLDKPAFLTEKLQRAYGQIRSAAPYAQLVVVGYPGIFPDSPNKKRKCGWLEDKELKAAEKLTQRLDKTIASAAAGVGLPYVSTLDALDGHEECSKDPWMYPIALSGGSQRGHPTKQGQKAIAGIVSDFLS